MRFFRSTMGASFATRTFAGSGAFRCCRMSEHASALGKLGLDPLEATEAEFIGRMSGRRARMKALLLDQRVLRGMGNIYTDESLWRAQIHPKRLGANLKPEEVRVAVSRRARRAERGDSLAGVVGFGLRGCRGAARRSFSCGIECISAKGRSVFGARRQIRRVIVGRAKQLFLSGCQPLPRTRDSALASRTSNLSDLSRLQIKIAAER